MTTLFDEPCAGKLPTVRKFDRDQVQVDHFEEGGGWSLLNGPRGIAQFPPWVVQFTLHESGQGHEEEANTLRAAYIQMRSWLRMTSYWLPNAVRYAAIQELTRRIDSLPR